MRLLTALDGPGLCRNDLELTAEDFAVNVLDATLPLRLVSRVQTERYYRDQLHRRSHLAKASSSILSPP